MADTRYIATDNIYAAPGVLAFTKGQVVPVSVVENLKAHEQVASDRTKAAAEAVATPDVPTPSASRTNRA